MSSAVRDDAHGELEDAPPGGADATEITLDTSVDRRTTRRLRSLLATAAVLTVALIGAIAGLISAAGSADDDRRTASVRANALEDRLSTRQDELRTADERIAELETALASIEDGSAAVVDDAAQLRSDLADARTDLREARRELDESRQTMANQATEIERHMAAAADASRTLTRIETTFPIELDGLGAVHPSGDFAVVARQQSCAGWSNCEPSKWEGKFDEIEVRCKNRCTARGLSDAEGDQLRFSSERGTWIANGNFGATCEGDPVKATWRIELRPTTLGLDGGIITVDHMTGEMKYAVRDSPCGDSDVVLTIETKRS